MNKGKESDGQTDTSEKKTAHVTFAACLLRTGQV
jgi:hypothetical protein